jgi:hypothetical protein
VQLFGSAVGANARLAFTGNSIGMNRERTENALRSLPGRVPKTVFWRLMLEKSKWSEIDQLLKRYNAALPAHWYVATRTAIRSVQLTPRRKTRGDDSPRVTTKIIKDKIRCQTNHFQSGPTEPWSWCDHNKESKERLKDCKRFVKCYRRLPAEQMLTKVLGKIRSETRKRQTSATIILAVSRSKTTVSVVDYFGRNETRLDDIDRRASLVARGSFLSGSAQLIAGAGRRIGLRSKIRMHQRSHVRRRRIGR